MITELLEIEYDLRELNTSLRSLRRIRIELAHNVLIQEKNIEAVKSAFMVSESYTSIKGIGNRKEAVVSELKPLRFQLKETRLNLEEIKLKIKGKEDDREVLNLSIMIAMERLNREKEEVTEPIPVALKSFR